MKKTDNLFSTQTDISLLKKQGHCKFKDYVTPDEIKIIAQMRELRKKGVLIRDRLNAHKSLNSIDPAIKQKQQNLQNKLKALRKKWRVLEDLRKKANHEKMVMLGHEPPPLT